MVKKLNRVLSIALILAVVGIGAFWMLQREKPVMLVEKAASPKQEMHHSHEWVQDYLKTRELTETVNQKMQRVRESQAYQDFLAADPDSMKDFLDFYAAQGVELPQAAFLGIFREIFEEEFQGKSAAELEPEMRQKLSMFLWEHNIHAGTDTKAEGFEDVIIAFFVEDANIAWAMQYFEGDYFAIGRWATDVLQHSGPTATEGPALLETTGASSPAQGQLPDMAPQGGSETMQSVTSSSLEFEVTIEPDADIFTERETGSQAGLTLEEAKSPDESLETSLRESFSSAQFSRALETLNRYGPEEGLRRLKAADPVVAAHVSRFLHKQQEEK